MNKKGYKFNRIQIKMNQKPNKPGANMEQKGIEDETNVDQKCIFNQVPKLIQQAPKLNIRSLKLVQSAPWLVQSTQKYVQHAPKLVRWLFYFPFRGPEGSQEPGWVES